MYALESDVEGLKAGLETRLTKKMCNVKSPELEEAKVKRMSIEHKMAL